MGSNGEFIITFISEKVKQGESPPEAAKKEIEEIDAKLHEAEKLKLRRMKLIAVLEHFGDETHRRRRNVNTPVSDDVDSENLELQKKIRAAVEKGPRTVRDIILEVGSYDQDVLINRTVKLMGEREIICRDSDHKFLPGKNW